MRKVIVSQATRRDAHNLDDSIDRWKLQKDIEANVEYLRLPDEILEGLSLSSLKTVAEAQAFKDTLQERRSETESILKHYNMLLRQYGKKPFFVKLYEPRRKAYVAVLDKIQDMQQKVNVILMGAKLYRTPQEYHSMRTVEGMESSKKWGVHVGRPYGSTEDVSKFLDKHPLVVDAIKKNMSLRKAAEYAGVTVNTVRKAREAMEALGIAS